VNGVFVDPAGERLLDRTYRRFLDRSADFDEILYACKTHVTDTILASELNSLAAASWTRSPNGTGARAITLRNGSRGTEGGGRRFPRVSYLHQ